MKKRRKRVNNLVDKWKWLEKLQDFGALKIFIVNI